MKHIYIFKIISFLIGASTLIANFFDIAYAYCFNKPLFVHFYPVKKKVSKRQKEFLVKNISFYQKLNKKNKTYFEHRLAIFMRTYSFIGRENFEITPEVMVLIASSYIKLTFGMRKYKTKAFYKIVVYPGAFYSVVAKQYHKGEYNPFLKMIVFSWEDFLKGDIITNDNINLGIHEFTHVLTFHGQYSNDISASIFFRGYKTLEEFVEKEYTLKALKQTNYFRTYAFTNKVEFLAVIMEHFIESPLELQQEFPKLYTRLERMLNYKSILNQL